jgi:hypothetical protein
MNARTRLFNASALVVLAGSAALARPAAASRLSICSDSQINYLFEQLDSVCGDRGGTLTGSCNGASISVNSIVCGSAV